jgi:hypothetical protein
VLMPAQPVETHIEPEKIEIREVKDKGIQFQMIEDLIREKARAQNLDENKIAFIAKCESQMEPEVVGDGHLLCKRTGQPMRSRGIWQLNDCGHPEISDEQAFDPEWSTNWAIEIFKKGREDHEWVICTKKYERYQKSLVAKK